MEIRRPFDTLQKAKNKRVLIELIDGRRFVGTLESFDLYLNIVLKDVELEDGRELAFVFLRSVHGVIIV